MTPKPEPGSNKILVVDDHDLSIRHALATLENSGSQVRCVGTADEAIKWSRTWLPDVICIDLHLQDLEGIETIRKIRQAWPARKRSPRFIVMTGDLSALNEMEISALQIDGLLLKPVSGQQLRQMTNLPGGKDCPQAVEEKCPAELHGLFRSELNDRLPQLDRYFAGLELQKMTGVLHQLIASAAIARENRFESELRSLSTSCRTGSSNHERALRYHAVLESARRILSHRQ